RHHEIVGGEFEPHLARGLDEFEILVGERKDGDFGEIDLLLARQREEKVERAFESLDVNDQRAFGARRRLGEIRIERDDVGVHACAACPPAVVSFTRSARAAATSNGCGFLRRASAASARRNALPASGGALAATSCISARSPLQWSATSQP